MTTTNATSGVRNKKVIAGLATAGVLASAVLGGGALSGWVQEATQGGATGTAGFLQAINKGDNTYFDATANQSDATETDTISGATGHAIADFENYRIVPGSKTQVITPFYVAGEGDNLFAKISADTAELTAAGDLADDVNVTYELKYNDGTGWETYADSTQMSSIMNDEYKGGLAMKKLPNVKDGTDANFAVVATIDFPASATEGMEESINLSNATVKISQVDEAGDLVQ